MMKQAKNIFICFSLGMIYSVKLQRNIPITIEKAVYPLSDKYSLTRYVVKDGKFPVGRVSVSDEPKGIFVNFIENFYPKMYKGFGKVADQIEVEHCLARGLKDFEINSYAAFNSHALHYLRGKRFNPDGLNDVVKKIIEKTPKGRKYNTRSIGRVEMYMPAEIIKKYIDVIKEHPLLKK